MFFSFHYFHILFILIYYRRSKQYPYMLDLARTILIEFVRMVSGIFIFIIQTLFAFMQRFINV